MSLQNSHQISDVKVMLVKGKDGSTIASIEKTGTSVLVDTYTITLDDGEKFTFTVTNGKGIESIEKTSTSGLIDTYTITFNDGTSTTYEVVNGEGYVTPQLYGAIANWESHPASDFYSSLEDLQEDYPLAQSLNDEMDLLAIEKALSVSAHVVLKSGGYYVNRTITLNVGHSIVGYGSANSQIIYNGTVTPAINSNHNVTLKGFKISNVFETGVVGTTSTITGIHANGKNRGLYEELQVVGFNYGIYFYQNAYCNCVNNCTFNYCNIALYGENEFNAIAITQSTLTYNKTGIRAGSGRSIMIENCTLERNNTGIMKINHGDIAIKGCYFELHNTCSIDIAYSSYPVDLATIENCSFYSNVDSEIFIYLNGTNKTIVNIFGNIFDANSNISPNTISCLKAFSNAVSFNIYDNFLASVCILGIDDKYINGYTNNGLNIVPVSSSNLTNAFNNGVKSVSFEFVTNGTVTLPDLSNIDDAHEIRKFVGYWTGGSAYTDLSIMTLDTTGITVIGETTIRPNVIYSVYYQNSKYFVFK